MPSVSTQRLYLPCPAPPTGSWRANLADALDTSALAQSVLAWLRRWAERQLTPWDVTSSA